jgi:MFS family permease
MELSVAKARTAVKRGVQFLRALPRDWDVSAFRTSIHIFFYRMVFPYLSIYIKALGASDSALGLTNSLGTFFAGLLGPFTGTFIDRFGHKKVYLFGILMLAASWLTYAFAQHWALTIVAMVLYWVGFETSMQGCGFICANSLTPDKRATAMSLCETFAAGLLGMAGPLLGAFIVTRFGGANIEGIRPLFFVSAGGALVSFILILTQLSGERWRSKARPSFWNGFTEVFQVGRGLRRFLMISALIYLPNVMLLPYVQVYARDAKGADPWTLGAMVTASAVTPFILGIPLGRLADKIGRKKVLFMVSPLFWASNILLILASNPFMLLLSGALQGLFTVSGVISAAMTFEMVPKEYLSRWMGMQRFFRMEVAAIAALFAGQIAGDFGREYLFIAVIALDAFIRIPLLISIPETLRPEKKKIQNN